MWLFLCTVRVTFGRTSICRWSFRTGDVLAAIEYNTTAGRAWCAPAICSPKWRKPILSCQPFAAHAPSQLMNETDSKVSCLWLRARQHQQPSGQAHHPSTTGHPASMARSCVRDRVLVSSCRLRKPRTCAKVSQFAGLSRSMTGWCDMSIMNQKARTVQSVTRGKGHSGHVKLLPGGKHKPGSFT